MRNRIFMIAAIAILFFSTTFYVDAQTAISLDVAIQRTAQDIENRLPQRASLVLVNFSSASAALSDYIIEELTVGLMDSGKLVVIDNNTLNRALVNTEIDLQLSGNVSDDTIVSLGRLMGADYALSGSLSGTGNSFRFEVFLIETRTQRRQSLGTRNIQSNERLVALINQQGRTTPGIPQNPLSADEFIQRGDAFMDRGDYANAIADFTTALSFGNISGDFTIFYNRAIAHSGLGNSREAIDDYTQAINRNGEFGAAFMARGYEYLTIRDFNRALLDANRAIQISPNSPSPYHLRGMVYSLTGEFDRSIADFLHIIVLQPENPIYHWRLSGAYYQKGELENAETAYREAVRFGLEEDLRRVLMEALSESYANRAVTAGRAGNHSAALADFSRAINVNPNNAMLFANRGMAYFNLGELDNSVLDYERALILEPGNAQYTNALNRVRRMRDLEAAWSN